MLAALLLQAAAPQTAVEAERAFNAAAQAKGQWTAFREFAAADAVMFVPQPVNAQQWLKDRKDPAKSVEWWPTASYVSCDGRFAVNTGGWTRADGSTGYFTTVWRKEPDGGWKWVLDSGDALKTPREHPAVPTVTAASCTPAPEYDGIDDSPALHRGMSADRSLIWGWVVRPDGARVFEARRWDGYGWDRAIIDEVAASPK